MNTNLLVYTNEGVPVKFYLPEELREDAPRPFRQQHRRSKLLPEEVREFWSEFSETSVDLYAPENLMPRAGEISFSAGVVVYDALFVALSPRSYRQVVLSAYAKRLKALLEGTPFTGYPGEVCSFL